MTRIVEKVCCGLAIPMMCLGLIAFVASTLHIALFPNYRWWLGRIAGVVVSDDEVFIASFYDARIYKFSLDGKVLGWKQIEDGAFSIEREGDAIIVNRGSNRFPISDPKYRVRDSDMRSVQFVRTWYGHPQLVMTDIDGKRTSSLQPWYLTMVQPVYPGYIWPVIAFFFLLPVEWKRRRRRRDCEQAGETLP